MLYNVNVDVISIIFCIVGVLPIITAGVVYSKTESFKKLSFFLFVIAAILVILSLVPFIRHQYFWIIVIFIVILDIILPRVYKKGLKENWFKIKTVDIATDEPGEPDEE